MGKGPIEPGNIDLNKRPVVKNEDGSISTVRSMGVNIDGQEVLIPTVSDDGRVLSDDEAIKQYMDSGNHLGKFETPEDSTSYAERLHKDQEKQYTDPANQGGVSPDAFSARLYDHDKREWVTDVSPAMASQLVQSGKFTYESGTRVQVVAPDGSVGSIPSENAYAAFKDGFRPMTLQDREYNIEQRQQKLDKDRFGNLPLVAATAGLLRGVTLGGSDVAGSLMGVGDELNKVREYNPGISAASEIGGIALTSMTGVGPVAAGGRMATGLGERAVARTLGEKATTSVLGQIAAKAAPLSAEGAYYGVGQGITETALGNPDHVVDNLISGVGTGALFGGLTGVVFGGAAAAKPYVDSLIEKGLTGSADIVNRVSTRLAGKAGAAVLDAAGHAELAKKFPQFADDPEFWKFASKAGGAKEIENIIKEAGESGLKEVFAQKAAIVNDLKGVAKGASDDVVRHMDDTLKQAGQDIREAVQLARDEVARIDDNLYRTFASQTQPLAVSPEGFNKMLGKSISDLRAQGGYNKVIADKLEPYLTSSPQVWARMTQGDQAYQMLNLLRTVQPMEAKLADGAAKKILRGIADFADNELATSANPMISQPYTVSKTYSSALDRFKNVADKAILRSFGDGLEFSQAKAMRSLMNPENRQVMMSVLDNFDQFGPEMKMFAKAAGIKDALKQADAMASFRQSVESKVKQMLPKAKVDADELEDVFRAIGKVSDVDSKLGKLRELQQIIAGKGDASSIEKVMAIKNTLGVPVEKGMENLAKQEARLNMLNQLENVKVPKLNVFKAALGMKFGDSIIGVLLGAEKGNMRQYAEALAHFQKASEMGAKLLSRGIKAASSALTGGKSEAIAKGVGYSQASASLKEKRKVYGQVREAIIQAQSEPYKKNDNIPQISQALEARRSKSLKFLADRLPEDPFELTSFGGKNTGYQPPDFELSKFYRYVAAANNPMSVLESIRKGTVTPEEVETLKELHANIYNDLQNSVLDGIIAGAGEHLSYKQKVELSILFDIPTDYTLRSDFIATMQAALHQDEGGRPEESGNGRKIEIDLKPNETIATQAQQITYS